LNRHAGLLWGGVLPPTCMRPACVPGIGAPCPQLFTRFIARRQPQHRMLRRSIDATGAGIKTAGRRKGERAAERESGSLPAEYLPNTYRIPTEYSPNYPPKRWSSLWTTAAAEHQAFDSYGFFANGTKTGNQSGRQAGRQGGAYPAHCIFRTIRAIHLFIAPTVAWRRPDQAFSAG
jgi:hypothetical protein